MDVSMKGHIGKHLASMVPQWYASQIGNNRYTIKVDSHDHHFYSARPLTPGLNAFLTLMNASLPHLVQTSLVQRPSFVSLLQEHYAIEWLASQASRINWRSAIDYLNRVAARTYENRQVSLNVVFSEGEGSDHIGKDKWQKIIDQLGASPFTYIRLSPAMKFLSYEQVSWNNIKDSTQCFYPPFLRPIHSILKKSEASAHVTNNGDIVIMDRGGLLASKRKGSWKIYDVMSLRDCIADHVSDQWIGANLFEVIFDLSFRRHGALLVYDPKRKVLPRVANKDSIISNPNSKSGQRLIAPAIRNISLGSKGGAFNNRRLLAEVASVDGAVIFDQNEVLAFGAVIPPHKKVGSQLGARSTAARSAMYHGGVPIKISSDGEITLHFLTNIEGEREDRIEFL